MNRIAVGALVAVSYFLTGWIGLRLGAVAGFATLIWPPAGIALAALLLGGTRYAWAVFAGAFTLNFLNGASLPVAAGIAIGNTLEALAAAALLRRFGDFRPELDSVRDVLLLLVPAALAPLIASALGVTSLKLGGALPEHEAARAWFSWWMGDFLGILVFAPLILAWTRGLRSGLPRPTPEAAIFGSLLACACAWVFGSRGIPVAFSLLPFVSYAAMRFGATGTTATAAAICLSALRGTVLGLGPFASSELFDGLLYSQTFTGVVTLTGLLLAAVRAELARAVMDREELLSIASHELKTPLAVMMLQREDRQISRMSRLVNEMLDISRIQSGRWTLKRTRFDLADLIREVAGRLQVLPGAPAGGVTVEARGPILGEWDRDRIEQVVENLLTNAFRYAPGKPACVEALTDEGRVVVRVSDEGPGISKKDEQRLFAKFQRTSASSAAGGLGVGLYLSRNIVEAHGGSLRLEPRSMDRPTTFVMELPISG